jgi:hypothetical protein
MGPYEHGSQPVLLLSLLFCASPPPAGLLVVVSMVDHVGMWV